MDTVLQDFPKIQLTKDDAYRLRQGQVVAILGLPKSGQLRIYNNSNEFIGLGEVTKDRQLKAKRLINKV